MVGTPASQFDVVRDGLADMSWIVAGYTPGRFKLAQMGELPFTGITKASDSRAFNEVYMKHMAPLNEFKGVELLSIWNIPGIHIATKKRPVNKLADLQGLKLRVASDVAAEVLKLTNAVPILKSSTEAFELLSTGAIDGSLMLQETPLGSNVLNLLDHYTIVPGGVTSVIHAMVINPQRWAQISEKDRKVIMEISGAKFAEICGAAYIKQDEIGLDAMKKANYVISTADQSFVKELQTALQPIRQNWIETAKAAGLANPTAVLEEYQAKISATQ
jgi:TRAP-type C4-dicarboxylate transport system substrate-binding protein